MHSLLAVAVVAVAPSIRTLSMFDPEGPLPRLNLGGEFPGAKGEIVRGEEAGVRFVRLPAGGFLFGVQLRGAGAWARLFPKGTPAPTTLPTASTASVSRAAASPMSAGP